MCLQSIGQGLIFEMLITLQILGEYLCKTEGMVMVNVYAIFWFSVISSFLKVHRPTSCDNPALDLLRLGA